MRFLIPRALCGSAAVAAAVAVAAWALTDAAPAAGQPAMPKEEQLRPKWDLGDSWVVETATKPAPAGIDPAKAPAGAKPVTAQWKFTVAAREKLGAAECLRIDITVLPDPNGQPVTKLWVDAKSHALRQFETQLPVDGGYVTVSEHYEFGGGQPAPVSGPLTAIPIDLPMFVGGRAGKQSFTYESASGAVGAKRAPTDVGFAVEVEQTMTPVKPESVRSLVPAEFSRDLESKAIVEVKLHSAERSVRQLWQVGQPWPVYAENGPTTARLVSVTPAKK